MSPFSYPSLANQVFRHALIAKSFSGVHNGNIKVMNLRLATNTFQNNYPWQCRASVKPGSANKYKYYPAAELRLSSMSANLVASHYHGVL